MCATSRKVNTLPPTAPPNMLRSISHVSNFKKRCYPIPLPPLGNHDPSHQIQPGLSESSSCVFWVPTRRQIYVVSKKFFMKSHAQSVPIKKCSCKIAQDMVCLTKSKRGHCENHIFLTHFLGMLCAPPPLSKQCLFQTGFMKSWSYTPNPS